MEQNRIKERLLKMYRLATDGVDGEKETAQKILEANLAKYGLTIDDLVESEDKKDIYWFTAKYQIEITGVKVERLQEINDKDCIAEGIIKYANGIYTYVENGEKIYRLRLDTPQKAYAELIDRISGKGTFAANPFVFVYEF